MTDRERADRQLGMYIAIGLVFGALAGALIAVLSGGPLLWAGVGAGAGLILATALGLGLDPNQR